MPAPSADVDQAAALASLGLSADRARELSGWLSDLVAVVEGDEGAEERALDTLLELSALGVEQEADKVFLMGGGVLDSLAELICICDEAWLNEPAPATAAEEEERPSEEEQSTLLELASRALNGLGAMCCALPAFVAQVLEEDRLDEPMDDDTVDTLAKTINTPVLAAAQAAAPAAAPAQQPFQTRQFGRRSELAWFPLLTAVLYWLRSERHRSLRAHAAFALSWLLTNRSIASLMFDAGLASFLFELLEAQLLDAAAAGGSRGPSGRRSGSSTPDPLGGGGGGAGGERLSVTQDNLRLYACISLQRLSGAGLPLFAADALLPAQDAEKRLQLLVQLLTSVHSFNVRAILLNILLQAVTPPQAAAAAAAGGAASASSTSAAAPKADLVLPASVVSVLRDFRGACGSIGNSRRASPAIGPASSSALALAPALQGLSLGQAATGASAPQGRAVARGSWRASPALQPQSQPQAAAPAPAPSSGGDTVEEDDDEVAELSRDPEAGIDKTKHLQQLVDAILAASAGNS